MSQEFNPSKTMQINKLKLEITDYLNHKAVADSCYKKSVDAYLGISPIINKEKEKRSENPNSGNSNYKRKAISQDRNLYQEKKELRQTKLLEYRRKIKEEQEEEDILALHRKSFTIKELKPEKKDTNAASDPYIF